MNKLLNSLFLFDIKKESNYTMPYYLRGIIMTEERKQTLIELLNATNNKDMQTLAMYLSDPRPYDPPFRRQTDKKAYKVFKSIIDPTSSAILTQADYNIFKISNRLLRDGGWFASRESIVQIENEEISMQDFPQDIVEGQRAYYLTRDENGYHPLDFVPEPYSFYYYARQTELEYMEERKVELSILHQSYTVKEDIMGGKYNIDPLYRDIAELLSEYLGYEKKEKVPTKE